MKSVPRPPASIWAIYAMGGGFGHFTRALSLARVAAKQGIVTRVITNSPFLDAFQRDHVTRLLPLSSEIEIVAISPSLPQSTQISIVLDRVGECGQDDVLVVDTFPRGIAGELQSILPKIDAFKVWVHRDLHPAYVEKMNLRGCQPEFDLIVTPGEAAPLSHVADSSTLPWTICDCDELYEPRDARAILGIDADDDRSLILVSGTGTPAEASDAAALAVELNRRVAGRGIVRFTSLSQEAVAAAGSIGSSMWPLMRLLSGVDLLIGSAGYNTVYEARAAGCRLAAIPQKRLYDRQSRRVELSERMENLEELASISARVWQSPCRVTRNSPKFDNGAVEAFGIIAERIASKRHGI